MSWLVHVLGLDNPSGRWELFWSGAGSDIGELALLGALVEFYRRHSCHVDSPRFCWRPGTHQVVGTPYRACRKHHPAVPARISAEHIEAAHANSQTGGTDDRAVRN